MNPFKDSKNLEPKMILQNVLKLLGYTFLLLGIFLAFSEYSQTKITNELSAIFCSATDCTLRASSYDTISKTVGTSDDSSEIINGNTPSRKLLTTATTSSESSSKTDSAFSTTTNNNIVSTSSYPTSLSAPNTSVQNFKNPKVEFAKIPKTTFSQNDIEISIKIQDAINPVLYLVSPVYGLKQEVVSLKTEGNYIAYKLPIAGAKVGEYFVLVTVSSSDGKSKADFRSARFNIIEKTNSQSQNQVSTSSSQSATGVSPVVTTTNNSAKTVATSQNQVSTSSSQSATGVSPVVTTNNSAKTVATSQNSVPNLISSDQNTSSDASQVKKVVNNTNENLPLGINSNPNPASDSVVPTTTNKIISENLISTTTVVDLNQKPIPPLEKTAVIVPVDISSTTELIIRDLTLEIKPAVKVNYFRILVKGRPTPDQVELQIRNTASTQQTFLGRATKSGSEFLYWLDSSTLPSGTYQIIAYAYLGNTMLKTTEQIFSIVAPSPTKADLEAIKLETVAIKQEVATTAMSTDNIDVLTVRANYASPTPEISNPNLSSDSVVPTTTNKIISEIALDDNSSASETVLPQQEYARELLLERKDQFNELFIRQASAVQTNDPTVLKMANDALSDAIKDLGQEADTTTKAEIERAATVEVDKIKKKIEKTENILKVRTNEKTSIDTDRDGISDYDELTIYGTNPKKADTDADGVLDGVEIMKGFNPKDSIAEAVVNFASPKDLTYVNETVLKVENIIPVLVYDDETDKKPLVHSEIRGFALPNSFVTLYIFSTPTVVTLRTGDDGSFTYVFEKELEDGEHEVYVALTDNAGEIVVQSNPFTFIKTAQAFTYEDDKNAVAISYSEATTAPEASKTLTFAIVMSIIALGLVFVLFGRVLQKS